MARVELGCEINKLNSVCDERGNTKKCDEVPISKVFELSPKNIATCGSQQNFAEKRLALICMSTISKQECCFQDLHLNFFV